MRSARNVTHLTVKFCDVGDSSWKKIRSIDRNRPGDNADLPPPLRLNPAVRTQNSMIADSGGGPHAGDPKYWGKTGPADLSLPLS